MKFKTLYLSESEQKLTNPLMKKFKVTKIDFKKKDRKFIISNILIDDKDIKKGFGVRTMLEIFKYCDKKKYDVEISPKFTNYVDVLGLDLFKEGIRVQASLII